MNENLIVCGLLFLSCYLCLLSAFFGTVSFCTPCEAEMQKDSFIRRHAKSLWMAGFALAAGFGFYVLSVYAFSGNY